MCQNSDFVCGKCLTHQLPFWILEADAIRDLFCVKKDISNFDPRLLNEIFEPSSSINEGCPTVNDNHTHILFDDDHLDPVQLNSLT